MRILALFLWVVSAAALVPDGPRACPPPKQPVKQERQPSAGGAAVVSTAVALALAAHTGTAPPALATAPNEYGSEVFTANKGGRIISLDVDVNKVVVLAKTKAVQNEVLDVAKALSPALKATPPDDVKGFLFELLGGRARGSINGEPVELDYKLEPGAISLTVRSRFIPSKPRDLLAPLLANTPPGKIDFAKGRVASDKGDPQGTSLEQTLGKALSEARVRAPPSQFFMRASRVGRASHRRRAAAPPPPRARFGSASASRATVSCPPVVLSFRRHRRARLRIGSMCLDGRSELRLVCARAGRGARPRQHGARHLEGRQREARRARERGRVAQAARPIARPVGRRARRRDGRERRGALRVVVLAIHGRAGSRGRGHGRKEEENEEALAQVAAGRSEAAACRGREAAARHGREAAARHGREAAARHGGEAGLVDALREVGEPRGRGKGSGRRRGEGGRIR